MTYTAEGLKFRAATDEDLPFLLELRRQTMSEHLRHSGVEPTEAERHERVRASYECAEIIMLSGMPVGLLKVAREGKRWNLIQIQLAPQQQGTGLGTRILTTLLQDAVQSGASVELSVLRANPARRLYERLGFRVVREGEHAYDMQFGA